MNGKRKKVKGGLLEREREREKETEEEKEEEEEAGVEEKGGLYDCGLFVHLVVICGRHVYPAMEI